MTTCPVVTRADEVLDGALNTQSQLQTVLPFDPVGGHQQYTAGQINTATTLTIPTGATMCWLQPLDQNIRLTISGTTPTTSKGIQVAKGTDITIPIGASTVIKVIAETAGASLEYQFGK